jgi:hypothetical protein
MLDLEHMQENVKLMFGGALGGETIYAVSNGVKLQVKVRESCFL